MRWIIAIVMTMMLIGVSRAERAVEGALQQQPVDERISGYDADLKVQGPVIEVSPDTNEFIVHDYATGLERRFTVPERDVIRDIREGEVLEVTYQTWNPNVAANIEKSVPKK